MKGKNFGADKSEGDDGGEAKIPQSSLGLSYYTQPITNSSSLSSFLSITVQSIPPQPNIIPAKNNIRKITISYDFMLHAYPFRAFVQWETV